MIIDSRWLIMNLNSKGQTLVEYILIISLITIIAIAIVNTLGGYLKDSVTKMSCSLTGKEYVEGDRAGEAACQEFEYEE